MIRKTFAVTKEDGRIVVNTPAVDRDNDRVLPTGADLTNYLQHPVLVFGHNYREPWATIGKAEDIQVSADAISIKPALRDSTGDADPMTIVRALWNDDLLAASIGFQPKQAEANEEGGRDFTAWELLEISLVPVPANQEALKLTAKAFEPDEESVTVAVDPALLMIDGDSANKNQSDDSHTQPTDADTEPTDDTEMLEALNRVVELFKQQLGDQNDD